MLAPMEGQSPPEDHCGECSSKCYFPAPLRESGNGQGTHGLRFCMRYWGRRVRREGRLTLGHSRIGHSSLFPRDTA